MTKLKAVRGKYLNGPKIEEFAIKKKRVEAFLEANKLDAVLLSLQSNVSWFTCGSETHVSIASTESSVSVMATPDEDYIIANNIEALRFEREELGELGMEIQTFPWQDAGEPVSLASKLIKGRIASDDGRMGENVGKKFDSLRYSLTEAEIIRYRELGANAAAIAEDIARTVKRGEKECEVAGRLAKALFSVNITPVVLLVAADERIEEYRHPIPTKKAVDRYMMIVLCARKRGLIVSLTRLVHFGKIPIILLNKHRAVVQVDATFMSESRPGAKFNDVFQKAVDAYEKNGFPGEWQNHHQGGPTGYQCRDFKATLEEKRTVLLNQALAWNPSIRGTKSEDTSIAFPDGAEIITASETWPKLRVEYKGKTWERPDILTL